MRRPLGLDDEVKELGDVQYVWIPRERNEEADALCNQALDKQERVGYYSPDSDSDYW